MNFGYGLLFVNMVVAFVGNRGLRADCTPTYYPLPTGPISQGPDSVAISPDGSYLATANFTTNNVTLWNVGAGGALSNATSYSLPSHSNGPNAVAFSPDGKILATSNNSNDITVFQVSGGTLNTAISYPLSSSGTGTSLVFSPDNSLLAVCDYTSSTVIVFTLLNSEINAAPVAYHLPLGSDGPVALAISPDSTYLATANHNSNDVTLFSISAGKLGTGTSFILPDGATQPKAIAFSRDGAYLAAVVGNGTSVFEVSSGVLVGGITYSASGGASGGLAFSPNGHYLVVTHNGITVYDFVSGVPSGGTSYPLSSSSAGPVSVVFSPDGSYLASADNNANNVAIFATTCFGSTTSQSTGTTGPTRSATVGTSSTTKTSDSSSLAQTLSFILAWLVCRL